MNQSAKILEAVRLMPDVTVAEIADLVPDVPHSNIGSLVSQMVRRGKLTISGEKANSNKAQKSRPVVNTYVVADPATQRKPNPLPVRDELLAEMKAELEALRAFQREALERHPDLAVPPATLAARKLVAELIEDKAQALLVMSGKKDDCLPMRAVLAAWEQGEPA